MLKKQKINIIFPGRHHMLTKFQFDYLKNIALKGVGGRSVGKIIFPVTSANHENTRRNPIPFYLRTLAIDQFSRNLPCEIKIYPIPDVKQTDKFAEYMLSQIFYQSGVRLNPQNTILACSTPPVINLFRKFGFKNLPVELTDVKKGLYKSLRPFEVIDLLVKSGKKWRVDPRWKKYASGATQKIYSEYNLGDLIQELFKDSLLGEDADITETRNYTSYAQAMDASTRLKFEDIKPFVVQGKIVDVGCSTGYLIKLLAEEFGESDIVGIEATRKFYEFCRFQEYASPFVFFYRRNAVDQNFKANSINTFIYSSIFHEIYSYIGEKSLKKVLKNTYTQLNYSGRIIIRDVVGPEEPDRKIYLELNKKDGLKSGSIKKLSTFAKFFRFVRDFKPRKIKYKLVTKGGKELIKLRLQDAYEYISKMNYTENWESEMHEEFGFYSFSKWKGELKKTGFKIVESSKVFKNPYIIDNQYRGKAALYAIKKGNLILEDYPPTNMILVGEK